MDGWGELLYCNRHLGSLTLALDVGRMQLDQRDATLQNQLRVSTNEMHTDKQPIF